MTKKNHEFGIDIPLADAKAANALKAVIDKVIRKICKEYSHRLSNISLASGAEPWCDNIFVSVFIPYETIVIIKPVAPGATIFKQMIQQKLKDKGLTTIQVQTSW